MSSSVLPAGKAPEVGTATDDVRAAAVEAAIALYRRHGIHEVSVADVARGAGLALASVEERFPTIDDLLPVTIAVWHDRRNAPIVPIANRLGAVAFLRAVVIANVEEPALMRLLMAAASIAATPGHPIAPLLQQQWVQFHALVQRSLTHDITVGREPAAMEPVWGAEQLIAVYEGLQVQSLLRPHMDLLASYDRAVARLREGWASTRPLPVWQL